MREKYVSSINRRQKSHKTFVGRKNSTAKKKRREREKNVDCIVLFLMFREPIVSENCEGEEIGKHGSDRKTIVEEKGPVSTVASS